MYAELRRLADAYVRREHAPSVQATELVHEAYLRLMKDKRQAWTNRAHFVCGAIGLFVTLIVSAVRNTRTLYLAEPLPITPPIGGRRAEL